MFPEEIADIPLKKDTKDDPTGARDSAIIRDMLIAIQLKLGIDGSNDVNSLDNKFRKLNERVKK